MFRRAQAGVGGHKGLGFRLRRIEGAAVGHEVGDVQGGQAVLSAAEEIAGAARLQIVFCDGETVVCAGEERQALAHRLGGVVGDKYTVRLARPAPYTAPQLV